MIKLCDVSTERLITFLSFDQNKDTELLNAYLALLKYSVKDYQQLNDYIESGKKEFNTDFFKNSVSYVKKNLEYANKTKCEPQIYYCENYRGTTVDKNTLLITDANTLGEVLLYKSPTILCSGKYSLIKELKISEIKDLLGKVTAHTKAGTGNNAFVEKMGSNDVENVVRAVNFYEKQVIRQAEETQKTGVNVFELNKSLKESIVRAQIKNIVKYLIDNAEVCVWGELTPAQKTRLMSAVTSYRGYENKALRQRMINVISNYTTLSELEEGVVKQKILDRFIIK